MADVHDNAVGEHPAGVADSMSYRQVAGCIQPLNAVLAALLLVSSLCLSQPLDSPPAWLESEAFGRLLVSLGPERSYQTLVLLPTPWDSRARGVSAYGPGEEPLQASPVLVGERLVAVEVGVPRSRRGASRGKADADLEVLLYLFEDATVPRPIADAYRRPVSLERNPVMLTTRPFTFAEMDRMGAEQGGRRTHSIGVTTLGGIPERPSWEVPPERRTALMRWEAAIFLPQAERIAFGADLDNVAWFVAVDGDAAAEWQRGTAREGGGRFGEPLLLEAGFHSLVFSVAQRHGEGIPRCLWRREGGAPEGEAPAPLYAGNVSPGWAAQLKDNPLVAGGICADLARYRFVRQGVDVMGLRCQSVGPTDGTFRAVFEVDGDSLEAGSEMVLSPRLALPAIGFRDAGDLGSMGTPQHPWFPVPVLVFGSMRILDLPPVAAHTEVVRLECRVDWPAELPEEVRQRLDLVCVQLAEDGSVLAEDPLEQAGRSRPAVAKVRIEPRAVRLSCQVRFGRSVLLPPADLRVLRPADEAVADITVQGRAVYLGKERALPVCDPLPSTPWTGRPGIVSQTGLAARLVLFDDLFAVSHGPEAEVLPERLMDDAFGSGFRVLRLGVDGTAVSGTAASVQALGFLPRLLDLNGDAVILAIGSRSQRAGVPQQRSYLQILFAAQACSARGALPVFVTLPSLPGVSEEQSREAALLIKEMALNLGGGIVDLYGAEKRGVSGMQRFAAEFATEDGAVQLNTPNNKGRRWMALVTADTLRPMLGQSPTERHLDEAE